MSSNHSLFSSPTPQNRDFFTIPKSLILQLGTMSLIGVVLGQKAASETILSIGQASEELFRGDRLPILPFPDASNTMSDTTDNTTTDSTKTIR